MFFMCNTLKERYRIGLKQNSWWSQIYIKLTSTNDDDSRKHTLKYFCLKWRSWWEINNLISRLEFIAQWAFYLFLFGHRRSAKFVPVISVSLFSRDRWPIDLKIRQVCQFIYWVDYIKCFHCQQLFCYQKPIMLCSFKWKFVTFSNL